MARNLRGRLLFCALFGLGIGCASQDGSSPGADPSAASATVALPESEAHDRSEHAIVGSWLVTDPNNPHFRALSTFIPRGGFEVTPASASVSDGHGVWERTDDGQFKVTFLLYHRDATGAPDHLIKRQEMVTLGDDGNSFHGTGSEETCDVAGMNCVTSTEVRDGVRITQSSFP